jgi:cell division inhibitor SulA
MMQFQLALTQPAVAPGVLIPATLDLQADCRSDIQLDAFSEIALSGAKGHYLHFLAPVLRDLSDNSDARWLTLIAPPESLSRSWLRDAGLNRERILLLQPREWQTALGLACDALSLGRSHTVVTWIDRLTASDRRKLAAAANTGKGQSLNVKMG